MKTHPIQLPSGPLAEGRVPAVCVPLVAPTRALLIDEARAAVARRPDLLEWRVDYFQRIAEPIEVIDAARDLRTAAAGLPVLFTRRIEREGGQPIPIDEERAVMLYWAVCESRMAEMVDVEMCNEAIHVKTVREFARIAGIRLILSFHDFERTPSREELLERFAQAERMGADVAKVAVMPHTAEDVLTLMSATLEASRKLSIPVAGMAMGGLGAVSRVVGGQFGSSLTFAVGQNASAPGQIPIEDLRAAMNVLRRAAGE